MTGQSSNRFKYMYKSIAQSRQSIPTIDCSFGWHIIYIIRLFYYYYGIIKYYWYTRTTSHYRRREFSLVNSAIFIILYCSLELIIIPTEEANMNDTVSAWESTWFAQRQWKFESLYSTFHLKTIYDHIFYDHIYLDKQINPPFSTSSLFNIYWHFNIAFSLPLIYSLWFSLHR